MNALVLAVAVAASPASFQSAFPRAERIQAAGRTTLVHASGFRAAGLGATPDAAARAFLRRHGASFGIGLDDALVLEHATPAGEVGPVRFERRLDGLRVFGGAVVVGVDAAGAVFLVNAAEVPPRSGTRFPIGARAAQAAAAARIGSRAVVLGASEPVPGWKAILGETRPAWQVDVGAASPAGDWRVWVDAETGRVLRAVDTRRYALGRVFELSPSDRPGSPCPLETSGPFAGAHAQCAATELVALENLSSGTELSGTQAVAVNCLGMSPFDGAERLADCVAVGPSVPAGAATDWDFAPDEGGASAVDDFAAVMAYYHADRQWTFLKRLDPANAWRLEPGLGLYTNVFSRGLPMANAFYAGSGWGVVALGQGIGTDFAYDGGVVAHEVTHGAIDRHGGFWGEILPRGTLLEPLALDEGSADALAAARTGSPLLGAYVARCGGASPCEPAPFVRDLGAFHTCRGTGAAGNDFGAGWGSVDGLDGEVHDDGEIWAEWSWELHRALDGFPACGGLCNAADLVHWRTVELTAGGSPSFRVFAATALAAADALFPAAPEVRDLVSCTLARRAMADCDGTVPVHLGEGKAGLVTAWFGAMQTSFEVLGTGVVRACDALSRAGTWVTPPRLYVRRGAPVQLRRALLGTLDVQGRWDFPVDLPMNGCADVTLAGPGTWYVLAYVPDADGQAAVVWVSPTSGVAAREAASMPASCALGGGPAPELCANGFDDDGDGATDCADPDCAGSAACQPAGPGAGASHGGCSAGGDGGVLALLALAAAGIRARRGRAPRRTRR